MSVAAAAAAAAAEPLQQQKRMLQKRLHVIKRASAAPQEALTDAVALNDALISLQFQLDEITYKISSKENACRTNVSSAAAFEKELERASRRKFVKAPRRKKQQLKQRSQKQSQSSQKQYLNFSSEPPVSPAERLLKHWKTIFQSLKPVSKNRKIKHAIFTFELYNKLDLEIPKHTGEIPALISALETLVSK